MTLFAMRLPRLRCAEYSRREEAAGVDVYYAHHVYVHRLA